MSFWFGPLGPHGFRAADVRRAALFEQRFGILIPNRVGMPTVAAEVWRVDDVVRARVHLHDFEVMPRRKFMASSLRVWAP
jgi:hypothetical protein